jgi:hypothetical protein
MIEISRNNTFNFHLTYFFQKKKKIENWTVKFLNKYAEQTMYALSLTQLPSTHLLTQ